MIHPLASPHRRPRVVRLTSGYTLSDTIVVFAIVGILAVALLLIYTGMQQKARDSQRMSDVQTLKMAIEQFYSEESEYPGPSEVSLRLTREQYINLIPADPLRGYQE